MRTGQFSPGSTTQRLCLASLPPRNISLSRSRSPCSHTADYRRPSPPPVLSETIIIRRKVPVHLVVGVRCCGIQGEMVMTIQFIEQTLRGFPVVLVAAEHYSLCCPVYVNHLILKLLSVICGQGFAPCIEPIIACTSISARGYFAFAVKAVSHQWENRTPVCSYLSL